MRTDFLFKAGKITLVMDGSFGSSGKGKIGSFIAENSDKWTFACNNFMPQAGHWVKLDDGRSFFYQTFNSCAYLDKYEKMYMGSGSVIEVEAFLREKEESNINSKKIGIAPNAVVLLKMDTDFERGLVDFDGKTLEKFGVGTSAKGSTAHGCGAAVARKALRRPELVYAKDHPILKEFVCDVSEEIMKRLDSGECGLGELAQGFPLSLNHPRFIGYTTSRNVTLSQFYSDMFLPVSYAGDTVINFRTFPIRINSNKYIGENGEHLTYDEVLAGKKHTVLAGNSGDFYPDSKEVSWDHISENSGSNEKIMEMTSVTKLPRRIATFSKENLAEAVCHNRTETSNTHLSLSFADYVDVNMKGERHNLTDTFVKWTEENLGPFNEILKFIGTGPLTNDTIVL